MGQSPRAKLSSVGSRAYSPTITPPEPLSGAKWRPLDASQAVESLRSSRSQAVVSSAHPIIESIRAEAMCPPAASGQEKRWWASWLLVECRQCGSLRAVQKQYLRRAIARGLMLYCSDSCVRAGMSESLRTRKPCRQCGGRMPVGRRATYCSDRCRSAARIERAPRKNCPQCSIEFRPRTTRTAYCSRSCANEAHAARMRGTGNSRFTTGTSYAKWFRLMRPLIVERDGVCVVCSKAPVLTFVRSGREMTRSALLVHHINEDVRDNRAENLILLCQTCHLVHHKSKTTPFPWFSTEATRRSTSMTSKWKARTTSLQKAYSSTTA